MDGNIQTSGLKFSGTKQTHARPVPPNPMDVHTGFEQDLTWISDHDLSTSADEETDKKSSASSLDEDVERG